MIVIADTSPLRYLILVEAADVLPQLFQQVLIPDEVYAELGHPSAPAMVQRWIADAPHWLEIRPPAATARAAIANLDAGEGAAILLAEQLGETAFLLMDDAKGRREAARRGIPSTGTLGVLRAASRNGYLVLRMCFRALYKPPIRPDAGGGQVTRVRSASTPGSQFNFQALASNSRIRFTRTTWQTAASTIQCRDTNPPNSFS
jgi:predicted nucleic acid-binding protein